MSRHPLFVFLLFFVATVAAALAAPDREKVEPLPEPDPAIGSFLPKLEEWVGEIERAHSFASGFLAVPKTASGVWETVPFEAAKEHEVKILFRDDRRAVIVARGSSFREG